MVEDAAAARAESGLPPEESFEHVAREWFDTRKEEWAPSYGEKFLRRLEVDVFPWVGSEPVSSITPPQLLTVVRRIEGRGAVETAHRALDVSASAIVISSSASFNPYA
ncbi:tyrosine-type recombinase/integrase [Acidovorax sp. LjRoot117]|uniref:tyrosine-type recombinase/integrase n=1 Tax=Acidovorax sp. LjRoot117 TaxID=3342255 RepID=UPI003ECCC9CE